MAEDGETVRYAMGIFEDMPRLKMAVSALLGLGLDARNICVAGESAAPENSNGEGWPAAEQPPHIVPLQNPQIVLGAPSGEASPPSAELPMRPVLEALDHVERSFALARRNAIGARLPKGALLVIALAPSAAVQAQAMRTLLRYSHHPVHSEEFVRTR